MATTDPLTAAARRYAEAADALATLPKKSDPALPEVNGEYAAALTNLQAMVQRTDYAARERFNTLPW